MLFPELEGHTLELPCVNVEEGPVVEAREKAIAMLCCNLRGPHKLEQLIKHHRFIL